MLHTIIILYCYIGYCVTVVVVVIVVVVVVVLQTAARPRWSTVGRGDDDDDGWMEKRLRTTVSKMVTVAPVSGLAWTMG